MIGETRDVAGYVTQDKYLIGRTLAEIEGYLGYHFGRLARGATFVKLNRLPTESEFALAAYSITPAHRHAAPTGLDIPKLKELVLSRWAVAGRDRLVKVIPGIAHDAAMSDDDQYPAGAGVPQWRLTRPIHGTVVAEARTSADTYVPML